MGTLMAHEALICLLGIGEPLVNRLLVFNGTTTRFREVAVQRDPACAVCGKDPVISDLQGSWVDPVGCQAAEAGA